MQRWTLVSFALLGLAFAASLVAYPRLPEAMPSHWNLAGEVDGTMPRLVGALFAPTLGAALYALLVFLPRVDPLRGNYAAFAGSYRAFAAGLVAFIAYIHVFTLAWALGYELPVSVVMAVGFAALFVGLGRLLAKSEPTWFVGIRTPWTLSDVRVWRATHRLGGRLFLVLAGLALASALLPAPWTFGVILGGVVGVALATVVYSFVAFRRAHPAT